MRNVKEQQREKLNKKVKYCTDQLSGFPDLPAARVVAWEIDKNVNLLILKTKRTITFSWLNFEWSAFVMYALQY